MGLHYEQLCQVDSSVVMQPGRDLTAAGTYLENVNMVHAGNVWKCHSDDDGLLQVWRIEVEICESSSLRPFAVAKGKCQRPCGAPADGTSGRNELSGQSDLDGITVLVEHIEPGLGHVARG